MYTYKNYKDYRNYDNLQKRVKKLIHTSFYYYYDNTGKLTRYNPYDNLFEIRNSIELALYM